MISITDKANCCGCGACAQICPNGCIAMKPDREGFLYPEADAARCGGCGLCESACFILQPRGFAADYKIVAAKNNDGAIRRQSSSGGLFTLLAEAVIDQGGVVFGAEFGEGFAVRHSAAFSKDGLARFRKSKYAQSETGGTFAEAKAYLQSGRQVLFSGTPCQIAGLKAYLGKPYGGLTCVDMICKGVPSPLVWRRYLDGVAGEYGAPIVAAAFREKETNTGVLPPGSPNNTLRLELADGRRVYEYMGAEPGRNIFLGGFLGSLYLRPSCHACKARGFTSGSDIQLGDFWGVEHAYPEFCDKDADGAPLPFGVSLVLLTSEKGERLFHSIRRKTTYFDADKTALMADGVFFGNRALLLDSPAHPERAAFFGALDASPDAPVAPLIRSALLHTEQAAPDSLFGLFGSDACALVLEAARPRLNAGFWFGGSNIVSAMSPPVRLPACARLPKDAYGARVLEDDYAKTFAASLAEYAGEVQFFGFDLLDDRLTPVAADGGYVTKSGAFLAAAGLSGIPLDGEHFELWKEKCLLFIGLVGRHFSPDRVFLFEFYLSEKLMAGDHAYAHPRIAHLARVNAILRDKYAFVKAHFPGIHTIGLPERLRFTDKYLEYGCEPWRYNTAAYEYAAAETARMVEARKEPAPPVAARARSLARLSALPLCPEPAADCEMRRDAMAFSARYKTLRNWMDKSIAGRPIGAYLKRSGYLNIAVYGFGEIGRLFLWEMRQSGVTVACAIDRRADSLFAEIPVLRPDGEYPRVDAVVVCVPGAPAALTAMLREKTCAPVLAIDELIYLA